MSSPPERHTIVLTGNARLYRDFFTPALHRSFTGVRALLLFLSIFCINVLRVSNAHVGIRSTLSPFHTLQQYLFTRTTLKTFIWYSISAWLFGEIYVWSNAKTADLRWVSEGKTYERPRLNERAIYIRINFAILAILQSCAHLFWDYDRIDLPLTKGMAAIVPRNPENLYRPWNALAGQMHSIIQRAILRSLMVTGIGPPLYWYFVRNIAWAWILPIMKLFHTLPKSSEPPNVLPFHITLVARAFFASFLLVCSWELSNKSMTAFTAMEPLKKHKPLTYDSKDPNGSLLTGLRAKKQFTRVFAFWELASIAQNFPKRRISIFKELDRKAPPTTREHDRKPISPDKNPNERPYSPFRNLDRKPPAPTKDADLKPSSTCSQIFAITIGVLEGIQSRIDEALKKIPSPLDPQAPEAINGDARPLRILGTADEERIRKIKKAKKEKEVKEAKARKDGKFVDPRPNRRAAGSFDEDNPARRRKKDDSLGDEDMYAKPGDPRPLPRILDPLDEKAPVFPAPPKPSTPQRLRRFIAEQAKRDKESLPPIASKPVKGAAVLVFHIVWAAINSIFFEGKKPPPTLEDTNASIFNVVILLLKSPFGWFFRQSFRRRAAIVVLGTPYGDMSVIINSINALTMLCLFSFKEDEFGQVRTEMPKVIPALTETKKKLEKFRDSIPLDTLLSGETSNQPRSSPEIEEILAALTLGLTEILKAVDPYADQFRISPAHLREAKQAVGLPVEEELAW
ncbi:MAG: hypothetical protein M1829_002845 [Trizodia sp. TS-e1964]|nr:MAG: hypothetical protein M1829_002845 [Trizodia sp. TS-e1964]